jgi:hypothetical protein
MARGGKRERRTHGGEEAGTADEGQAAGEADALRGLRGQAAQAFLVLHGLGGRPHDDALVVLEIVWVFAGFGGLVENCAQLVALVAALGKKTSKFRCWKISMPKMFEQFPYLHHMSELRKGGSRIKFDNCTSG